MTFVKQALYFICCLLCFPGLGQAKEYFALYSVDWSGLHLADMVVRLEEGPDHYKMENYIKASGMIGFFNASTTYTTAEGKRNGTAYEATYFLNRSINSKGLVTGTEIRYPGQGQPPIRTDKEGAAEVTVGPDAPIGKRPPVPVADQLTGYDPITLFLIFRHKVMEEKSAPITLNAYDGKRLFRVDGKREARNTQVEGFRDPVHRVLLMRTPLKGYSEKELRRMKRGNAPFTAFLSTTPPHAPALISGTVLGGDGYIRLKQFCDTLPSCLEKAQIKVPKGLLPY